VFPGNSIYCDLNIWCSGLDGKTGPEKDISVPKYAVLRFAPFIGLQGYCWTEWTFSSPIRSMKMQKINRAELAKSAVAGGCCKNSTSTTTVIVKPAARPVATA
jgi:hypothetical protein